MPEGAVTWPYLILIVTIVATTIGATWRISHVIEGLKGAIETVKAEVCQKIEDVETESMESRVVQAWAAAKANPGLRIPDPRDPGSLFVVVSGERSVEHHGEPIPGKS
jgi:hypothetical protein